MGHMPSTTWLKSSDHDLSSADRLCDGCCSLGPQIRQLCEFRNYSISIPLDSVETNRWHCDFCEMISSNAQPAYGESQAIIKIYKVIMKGSDGIQGLLLRCGRREMVKLDIFTTEGSIPATAKHVQGRCIKAASNLDRAKDWLNDCLRNHDHDGNRTATRPSRLVAVGTANGLESIKIVDGSDADKEYLAVSYRWGAETLLTTIETSERFHHSIPWEQLPHTFQDAISIARKLGIRYIWIDSLCIIQDDLADWDTESARMADIYNGAVLTIMAASASDSRGGFFRDRPMMKDLVALPYTDASGATQFSVFVSKPLPDFGSVLSHAPLFQRGWVFQERLMSKRKLIFGEDQTYWECNSAVLSESNIRSRRDFGGLDMRINGAFRVFSDPSYRKVGISGPISPASLWKDVVQTYSPCALTYEADRLPALSGLARIFAQRFGSSYAAGLWQNQMPHALLWNVTSLASKKNCNAEYCAPSWSWASTIGAFGFNFPVDPYGRVCPGSSMCVRGRLCSGKLVRREGHKHMAWLETKHRRFQSLTYLDRDDQDVPLEVVYVEVTSSKIHNHHWYAGCLLLRRTGEHKHFRRVGMARVSSVDRDADYLFLERKKKVITLV